MEEVVDSLSGSSDTPVQFSDTARSYRSIVVSIQSLGINGFMAVSMHNTVEPR